MGPMLRPSLPPGPLRVQRRAAQARTRGGIRPCADGGTLALVLLAVGLVAGSASAASDLSLNCDVEACAQDAAACETDLGCVVETVLSDAAALAPTDAGFVSDAVPHGAAPTIEGTTEVFEDTWATVEHGAAQH